MSAQSLEALDGASCAACSVTVYPAHDACPRCGQAMSSRELSTVGSLWTWTAQRFAPKSPPFVEPADGFRPFALGYVELPEGVRVLAVLDTDDLGSIEIGMPVRIHAADGVPRACRRGEAHE
jgi:uncharacterized protein